MKKSFPNWKAFFIPIFNHNYKDMNDKNNSTDRDNHHMYGSTYKTHTRKYHNIRTDNYYNWNNKSKKHIHMLCNIRMDATDTYNSTDTDNHDTYCNNGIVPQDNYNSNIQVHNHVSHFHILFLPAFFLIHHQYFLPSKELHYAFGINQNLFLILFFFHIHPHRLFRIFFSKMTLFSPPSMYYMAFFTFHDTRHGKS